MVFKEFTVLRRMGKEGYFNHKRMENDCVSFQNTKSLVQKTAFLSL